MAFVARQTHLIVRHGLGHISDTRDMVIHTRHEHGPCWRAGRRRIEARKHHTILGEPCQRRCFDLTTKRLDVRETHIINNDQQKIGPSSFGRGIHRFCAFRSFVLATKSASGEHNKNK